jgi:ABC-2 type transport system permease protein
LGNVILAFLRRALLERTVFWTSTLMQAAGFVIGLLSQAFLGRFVDAAPNGQLGAYAGRYSAFLLVGISALDLQTVIVGGLANEIREAQHSGSLEALLATPTPAPLVLAGLVVPDLAAAVLRLTAYAALGSLLFGLRWDAANAAAVVLVLVVASVAFGALALVGATLTMELRRANPLSLLIASSSLIAGGVIYPRAILPRPLALAGQLLPITPALDALRAAVVQGAAPSALGAPLAHLCAFAVAGSAVGAWLFSRALARARSDGSLTSH